MNLLEATIGMQTFPSLSAMYNASPTRERSGESDFGVHWRTAMAPGEPWRATWIMNSGEFYIVKLRWPTDPDGPTIDLPPAVFILGVEPTRDGIERRVEGWAEKCGDLDSLDWLIGKFVE